MDTRLDTEAFALAMQRPLTKGEVAEAYLANVRQVIDADAVGMYQLHANTGRVVDSLAATGIDFLDDYERYGRADDPVLEHVIVLAEVQTLKGRRFGNLVIAASRSPLPTAWLPRLMAAGPHPAKVAQGAEVVEFARGARVATDVDATASPKPSSSLFDR